MARNRSYVSKDLGILKSPDFDVVTLEPQHSAVARATGRDLSWTIRLAKCLPLGLRGADHKAARRALILLLAESKQSFLDELPSLVSTHFHCLKTAGTHDVLNDVLVPFVDDTMVLLGGFPCPSADLSMNSSIFDPACAPSRRIKLENSAKRTFQAARAAFPDASDDEINRRVATVVMGHDALLGALAESLTCHVNKLHGKPLSEAIFPREPLGTGVPYVWRQRVTGAPGSPEAQGDILELRLDTFTDAAPRDRMNMFGDGAHVCPGRALALKIFDEISRFMATLDVQVSACSLQTDPKHVLKLPVNMTMIATNHMRET